MSASIAKLVLALVIAAQSTPPTPEPEPPLNVVRVPFEAKTEFVLTHHDDGHWSLDKCNNPVVTGIAEIDAGMCPIFKNCVADIPANAETLPPSFNECVNRGLKERLESQQLQNRKSQDK